MMPILQHWRTVPIVPTYPSLTPCCVQDLKMHAAPTRLAETSTLCLARTYYHMGLVETSSTVFARQSVAQRLSKLQQYLPAGFGVLVFDAFRTHATQVALFHHLREKIRDTHPTWNATQLDEETVRYVAHPEMSRYPVLPHNSGGAIDLTLTFQDTPLDMGTNFDEPSLVSAMAYFEGEYDPSLGIPGTRWITAREHRRLLFHAMVHLGFTSNPKEWWHFDVGDCLWARVFSSEWYYPSMENEMDRI